MAQQAAADLLGADPEQENAVLQESAEQAHAMRAYFQRLVDWLGTPPPTLAQEVAERLQALPPVAPKAGNGQPPDLAAL
jgi:hypothetical protein